jgi:hypothetical protein
MDAAPRMSLEEAEQIQAEERALGELLALSDE